MLKFSWCPKKRASFHPYGCVGIPVTSHPLHTGVITKCNLTVQNQKKRYLASVVIDYLGAGLDVSTVNLDNSDILLDPLTRMALESTTTDGKSRASKPSGSKTMDTEATISCSEPWFLRRQYILDNFNTNERLSITSSFLVESGGGGTQPVGGGKKGVQVAVNDRVQHRLEQLDEFDSGSVRRFMDLSQQEYITRINELRQALLDAWESDQRVTSIKIVIQCAKMLRETTIPQFYPSKFVLITDILDLFGNLVFSRLFSKASADCLGNLDSCFSPENIPENTKETARNWFFKIASIRELLPRFYVEAAILKSAMFLKPAVYDKSLNRLVMMNRGIGDPLVATYARCYLVRVGLNLDPGLKDYNYRAFADMIFSSIVTHSSNDLTKVDSSGSPPELLSSHQHSMSNGFSDEHAGGTADNMNHKGSYGANEDRAMQMRMTLFAPAMDWVVHGLSRCPTEESFNKVFQIYFRAAGLARDEGRLSPYLLCQMLEAILKNFPAQYFASRALECLRLISELAVSMPSKVKPLVALGNALLKREPTDDRHRVLNDAWKLVRKCGQSVSGGSLDLYLEAGSVWFAFCCVTMTSYEINTLLGDVVRQVTIASDYDNSLYHRTIELAVKGTAERHCPALIVMLKSILQFACSLGDFAKVFGEIDCLVSFLDLFQSIQSVKLQISRLVLEDFVAFQLSESADVSLGGHMLAMGKTLHDSLNAMSLVDEIRQTSDLIINSLNKFKFCGDFEQQLNFFVDSRGAFTGLDLVIRHLVCVVNRLTITTLVSVNGNHSRKTANFARACIAYVYITIPSISDLMTRFRLYLESISVALMNGCLPQTDSLVKSTLALFGEFTSKSTATGSIPPPLACDFAISVKQFLSLLLLVPDSPETGTLHHFRCLLNAIHTFPWPLNMTSDPKLELYCSALKWLTVAGWPEYPYRIELVISNDRLYGGDETKFGKDVQGVADQVLELIFDYLKALGDDGLLERQSNGSLAVLSTLLVFGDLMEPSMCRLALNLWNLAIKTGSTWNQGKFKNALKLLDRLLATIPYDKVEPVKTLINAMQSGYNQCV